jgi:hypothetical protein
MPTHGRITEYAAQSDNALCIGDVDLADTPSPWKRRISRDSTAALLLDKADDRICD